MDESFTLQRGIELHDPILSSAHNHVYIIRRVSGMVKFTWPLYNDERYI